MHKTKALVIGGGPAGSSAAYYLAKQGIDVVVLDKDKWPRDKVCGGGLTVNCVPILERMGLINEVEKIAGSKFDNYVAYWYDGKKIEAPIQLKKANSKHEVVEYSYVVRRDLFDDLLLKHAEKAGAIVHREVWARSVKCGEKVVVTTKDGQDFEADVLVVADGSGGSITRLFQTDVHKGSAISVRGYYSGVKGLSEQMECYLDQEDGWCFGWIFPLGNDKANVGFGIDAAYKKKRNINVKQRFHKLLESPLLKERFADAKLEGKIEAFPLRMGYEKSLFRKDKILFAGDSAKLIYPLSGEGIAYALQSGEIAADVIANAYQEGSLDAKKLSEYEKQCRKEFGDFHYATKMQKMMGRPKLLGSLFRTGMYNRKLGLRVMRILEHSTDAKSFFSIRSMFDMLFATAKRKLRL